MSFMASLLSAGAQDKFRLQIVEAEFQTHGILMRVHESLYAHVKHRKLRLRPLANIAENRRLINEFSATEDRHEQILEWSFRLDVFATCRVKWINDHEGGGRSAFNIENSVTDELFVGSKSSDLLDAWRRDLRDLFAQLHFVNPAPAVTANRTQFVNATERRLIVGRDQFGAHAPDVDHCALRLDAGDDILVEVVARHNDRIREARRIEKLSPLDAQPGQIAGIESDAHHFVTPFAKQATRFHGPANAFQRVVSVHEKHAVVRHCFGVSAEGFPLVIKRHHPTVGMGPPHWNAIELRGENIRCGSATADVSGTAGCQRTVHALCPTQSEFQHRLATRRQTNPGGLRRDKRLEVDKVQQRRLQQLTLQNGSLNPQQRFLWKDRCSLRDRINIAAEAQCSEVIQKSTVEELLVIISAECAEKRQIILCELEGLKKLNRRRQARC